MKKKLRVVFSGTPDFARICLEHLLNCGVDVALVVTAPDRKKGRGQQVAAPPVKLCAMEHGLPILQPPNLKDKEFLDKVASYHPDIGVVVAFRMMPEALWNMPELGTINLHASLLPDYRGAAPINWVLINGDKKTGLTTFFLKHQIDTGDIILQEEVEIRDEMDAGQLHDILARKGAELLFRTLEKVSEGQHEGRSQDSLLNGKESIHQAPKIFKDDCRIDWNQDARSVHNLIRGLSPYPGAWTTIVSGNDKKLSLKIFKTALTGIDSRGKEGKILLGEDGGIYIGTGDEFLSVAKLQLEGRQVMDTPAFLRGYRELLLTQKHLT